MQFYHTLLTYFCSYISIEHLMQTALYAACKNGEERMVKFLLKNNANVNTEGCLAVSLELYNWNIFLELINYGAAAAWVSLINNFNCLAEL